MSDPKGTTNCDQPEDNKSWVEICDEDSLGIKEELPSPTHSELKSDPQSVNDNEIKNKFSVCEDSEIKEELLATVKCDSSIANSTLEDGEVRSDLDDTIVEKDNVKDEGFASTAAISNILSYAKVLSRGSKPESVSKRKPIPDVPTEDLSLTSHLDIFHVDSPCKEVKKEATEIELMWNDEDTMMVSPVKKEETPAKNMKRPFQLIESPVQHKRERTSSVRSIHKVAKSNECSDVHSSQTSSSGSSKGSPSTKREIEENPDILARRQKQIDYGKNTKGYEKYCLLVPKNERTKEHPKTPPKDLKFSRRAWDGLIKNWRLKLHKWDSAAENDDFDKDSVNSDQYSVSSEVSYYDSSSVKSDSTPSTPSQPNPKIENGCNFLTRDRSRKIENPKEFRLNCPQKSDKSDDDDYLGCESLNENCVKACS